MTTPPEAEPTRSHSSRAGALRVGSGILVSRLLGLVRERVFGHYFGSTDFADAWRAATRLPNVIRNLLGEGTLSASIVPVYAEMIERGDEDDARRFAGAALGLLAVVAGTVALVGFAIAPWVVRIVLPLWTPEKQALTTSLIRIVLPMVGVFVLSAWAMSILDSHRRFFVSYVAPAMWNVATITAMLGGAFYFGLAGRDLVLALAWGALVGGVLQLGLQLPFVFRHLGAVRPLLGLDTPGIREALTNFWPVVVARGAVNLGGWFEIVLAGFLSGGTLALLGYAQTLYLLPISLFGISVAASELPELSRMRDEDRVLLADRVRTALARTSFFLVPSALGYLLLGDVAVAAVFQTGVFSEADTLATWAVLAAFALGLPATASSRVLSSAFYALRDTKTPAKMAYVRIAVSLTVGFTLMWPLDRMGVAGVGLGAAGLALGSAAGAWLEYVLLRRALGRSIGVHGAGRRALLLQMGAAAVAAAAGVALQLRLPPAGPWITAVETLLPFGVLYLLVAHFSGVGVAAKAR